MIYLIIDLITNSFTKYSLSTFLYEINYLKFPKFIACLIFQFFLTQDIIYIIFLICIFLINKFIYRIFKYNLWLSLILYIIFYVLLYKVDYNILINIILVILLYFHQYNKIGDSYQKNF